METYDEEGNPGDLIGVEMRGHEILGTLESGDWVEMNERPKPGEGLRPKEVRNLTSDDIVKSHCFVFTT